MDYINQATDFLNATNTKMSFKYLKHAKHFIDDTATRDIWTVILKNDFGSYTLEFGNSIMASNHGNTPPSAYDVLACIEKNDPGDLYNFCTEYGYDIHDQKSKKIYNLVLKEWEGINNLFTDDELELLREIR